MRKDMMEILVCPVDKGTLTLAVTQENADEVVEGTLDLRHLQRGLPDHGIDPEPAAA